MSTSNSIGRKFTVSETDITQSVEYTRALNAARMRRYRARYPEREYARRIQCAANLLEKNGYTVIAPATDDEVNQHDEQ